MGDADRATSEQGREGNTMECYCKYSDADYEALERETEKLRSALEVIAGPEDRSPWLKVYREAGGNYPGLQAIAEKALGK